MEPRQWVRDLICWSSHLWDVIHQDPRLKPRRAARGCLTVPLPSSSPQPLLTMFCFVVRRSLPLTEKPRVECRGLAFGVLLQHTTHPKSIVCIYPLEPGLVNPFSLQWRQPVSTRTRIQVSCLLVIQLSIFELSFANMFSN